MSSEPEYDLAQPEPSALIESLRAFGYSLSTAVADIIDNSIAANAKNVHINFEWKGRDSTISIEDDGDGMTETDLIHAMRLGCRSPIDKRSKKDLGRFGLGLKTASFSQCRRMTVFSKVEKGGPVVRCWDLDYVNKSKQWRLLKNSDSNTIIGTKINSSKKGTVVYWEKLDRLTGNSRSDDDKSYSYFLESIDRVKNHLSMVFGRYLERPDQLKILVNGNLIKAWDPFMKSESATQELPLERLKCNGIELTVRPFVLPHQSKITKDTFEIGAGPNGWIAQQGFYVYRNERLLVAGDWLGMNFHKDELHKLARIQIDLPNSMDADWQIDVKKSRAKPPSSLKSDLKRIAVLTRKQAVQIYQYRGKVIARQNSKTFVFLWEQKVRHGKCFYSINRDHPLVKQVYQSCDKTEFDALLKMIEESIPLAHILVTSAKDPDSFKRPFEDSPPEELLSVLKSSYHALINSGTNQEEAKKRLSGMDPFNHFPEFVERFLSDLTGGLS